jgi:hypothetical protein
MVNANEKYEETKHFKNGMLSPVELEKQQKI